MNNENSINEAAEMVEVSGNALATLEKASIDMQISTAKQYPRSLTRFKDNMIAMATMDEETATSCLYRRPVGKSPDGKQVYAEGMSVRMAEIVASSYGNLRIGARIVDLSSPRYVVAQGVTHDLENNVLCTSDIIEPTVDKYGKPYSERMRVVIIKAAIAKARRDSIFQVVPRSLAKCAEIKVKELLFGDSISLSKWRAQIGKWVNSLGIDEKRVWAALDIVGADDLKQKDIEILFGIKTALTNGDTSIDEAFPEIEKDKRFQKPQRKSDKKEEGTAIESNPSADNDFLSDDKLNFIMTAGKSRGLSLEETGYIIYNVSGVDGKTKSIPAKFNDAIINGIKNAEPGKVIPDDLGF